MQLSKVIRIHIIKGSSGESETPETSQPIAEHRSPITHNTSDRSPLFWLALPGMTNKTTSLSNVILRAAQNWAALFVSKPCRCKLQLS
jgi:hypothetical protein